MERGDLLAIILAILLVGTNVFWAYYSTQMQPTAPTVDPIKVGVLIPLTGPTAYLGENIRAAARMAMEEINEMGGVLGRPLEIVVRDTEGSAEAATVQYEKMATVDKIDVLIGVHRSGVTLALMDLIAQHRTPSIFVGPASTTITEKIADEYDKYKTMFRLNINTTNTIHPQAHWFLDILMPDFNLTKYAIIHESSVYAVEESTNLKAYLADHSGPELVYEGETDPAAIDFSAEIAQTTASGAQACAVIMSTSAAVTFLKQYTDTTPPWAIGGSITMFMSDEGIRATQEAGNYVCTLNYGINKPITDKTVPFFDKFFAATNWWPSVLTFHEYDGFYVFKDAAERAGTLDEAELVAALEETNWTGVSGRIKFTSNHDLMYGAEWRPILFAQWFWENEAPKAEIIWPVEIASADMTIAPWVPLPVP